MKDRPTGTKQKLRECMCENTMYRDKMFVNGVNVWHCGGILRVFECWLCWQSAYHMMTALQYCTRSKHETTLQNIIKFELTSRAYAQQHKVHWIAKLLKHVHVVMVNWLFLLPFIVHVHVYMYLVPELRVFSYVLPSAADLSTSTQPTDANLTEYLYTMTTLVV